ncbi:hypothetical protein KUBF_19230 [Bacteroides finegoldii]|nr:hypothetical protein KUBF_19230 [Bacteroides finegoldii]
MAMKYGMRADTLKNLVENELWNTRHQFFETMRTDSSANVREAIGYIPWYFNCRIPPKSMKLPGRKLWMKKASLLLMD